ncbi:MAG: 30S ribosomal protein S13, partial [Candidatus Aenigmarchaeota archaeon]|nr:30S ribosomal protein S13 [Candidatus Aenigmarchaeota archaeon]
MAKNDIKTDKLKVSPKAAAATASANKPRVKLSKNIIRIKGTDVVSDKKLGIALTAITGVDYNLSRAILHVAGMDHNSLVEGLSEKDIEKLEGIIDTPIKSGIPAWLLNRRNDYVTGDDMHLTGSD